MANACRPFLCNFHSSCRYGGIRLVRCDHLWWFYFSSLRRPATNWWWHIIRSISVSTQHSSPHHVHVGNSASLLHCQGSYGFCCEMLMARTTTLVLWSFSGTTWVSQYQNVSNLDFTGAKDDADGGDIKIIIISKPTFSFLQARCPSCHSTNSVRALK